MEKYRSNIEIQQIVHKETSQNSSFQYFSSKQLLIIDSSSKYFFKLCFGKTKAETEICILHFYFKSCFFEIGPFRRSNFRNKIYLSLRRLQPAFFSFKISVLFKIENFDEAICFKFVFCWENRT
jgi:hypothetical protein